MARQTLRKDTTARYFPYSGRVQQVRCIKFYENSGRWRVVPESYFDKTEEELAKAFDEQLIRYSQFLHTPWGCARMVKMVKLAGEYSKADAYLHLCSRCVTGNRVALHQPDSW